MSTRGRRLGGRVGEGGASRDLRASERRRGVETTDREEREEKRRQRGDAERRGEKRNDSGEAHPVYICVCVYIYIHLTHVGETSVRSLNSRLTDGRKSPGTVESRTRTPRPSLAPPHGSSAARLAWGRNAVGTRGDQCRGIRAYIITVAVPGKESTGRRLTSKRDCGERSTRRMSRSREEVDVDEDIWS